MYENIHTCICMYALVYGTSDVQWDQLDEAWHIFDTNSDGLVTPSKICMQPTHGLDD